MNQIKAFGNLAEKLIKYFIKEIKKGLREDFIAFIVYGSYASNDFTLNSDIDCYVVVKKSTIKGISINHWLGNLLTRVHTKLNKSKEAKLLGKYYPPLSFYDIKLEELKKSFFKQNPSTLDVLYFGKLYYPHKGDPIKFLKLKTQNLEKRKYIKITFEKDVKHLLKIHVRQFIKKCLLVGRRLYFIKEKEQLKRTETSKKFDNKFKNISKKISLTKLNNNLNKDLDKLDIKELIEIISQCNKFLLLTKKYSLKI